MFLHFSGRRDELSALGGKYESGQFEFMVIYGRRRIGKTTLIKKFMEGKNGIYFLCDKAGTVRNAARLKRSMARFLDEPPIESDDLYDIFGNLARKTESRGAGEKTIIVLDEFSYLVEKDDAIPSIFQNIIDEFLRESNVMLILCGSSMSMMEKGVLSYKSPLYGRKTGHMKLSELSFIGMQEFFPDNSLWKNIEFYSILGGVPHYLGNFSGSRSTSENVREELFSKSGRMYEEIEFLLKEEFREPDIYKAILTAIAAGCTRLVDIANRSSIPRNDLPRYLRPLLSLEIIAKEYSVIDFRRKKPLYHIRDKLTNFWFTFCEPFKSELEVMDLQYPMKHFETNFNTYLGKRFEKMVREQLLRKVIPFQARRIGKLWHGNVEIDAVATGSDESRAALVEIKFKEEVDPYRLMERLKQKLGELPVKLEDISFLMIAKSFTEKIDGCYTVEDLLELNS